VSHGPPDSWVEDLAMAGDERGYWPSYVGELGDATAEGNSESVSTMERGI
jgi:hypothetical protein